MSSPARIRVVLSACAAALVCALAVAPAQAQPPGTVTVAVIDTGVDVSQFAGSLWTNSAEVPANGVDDDANGIVDDVHGADLADTDGDPSDRLGHGTEMAGLVRARAHAPVALMPVKVFGAGGSAQPETVAAGLDYAVAHGARILLVCLNTRDPSPALAAAVRAADAAGAVIVASAGNDGANLDAHPSYPAAYPAAGVLAVGSVAPDGSLSAFSNRGPGTVDVAVPGEDLTTIGIGGRQVTDSGTSEAAAATAGTMARLAAARPASSASQLAHALREGARRTRGLIGHITFGQVDVAGSLARLGVVRAGAARVSLHLSALTARRSRRATVVRWHASGPADEILRFRVRVGRRVHTLRAGRSGRRSWALRLQSRPGRVTVVALGAGGRPLAKLVGPVRPA